MTRKFLVPFMPICILLFMVGCEQDSKQMFSTELAGIKNQKDLKDVAKSIEDYLATNPSDSGCIWYGLLGTRALAISRTLDAEAYFMKAVRDYPACPETPNHLLALSNIYKNYLQWEFVGEAICCVIKDRVEQDLKGEASSCCPSASLPVDSMLVQLRAKVFDATQNKLDAKAGRNYIALCQVRALLFPEDPSSADHLNEAAKVAKAIQMPLVAVDLYDWILTDYIQTMYGPKAIFLKAFTYETDLADIENARKFYTQFVKEYPTDEFADDAQLLLQNLGKDPEELIRQFEKSK
jgi:tetratricopeptide (TPR) repeat protein